MIELYVFVNPLGLESLRVEKEIIQLVDELNAKIHFRFIPIVNMKSIQLRLKARGQNHLDLDKVNQEFSDRYAAALDLKAVQLQGRKKGREFLLAIQKEVAINERPYSQELVFDILEKINIDKGVFLADRQSPLIKKNFTQDQQMVHEMGLVALPNAVIFNYESEEDGFIIEEETLLNIRDHFEEIFHVHLKAYHLSKESDVVNELDDQSHAVFKLM